MFWAIGALKQLDVLTDDDDHEEKCGEIVFLQPGTLDDYTDKYDKPARFEFRDDLLLKKVSNSIIFVWNINSQDEVDVESDSAVENCQTCYSDSITKPLNMKTFDNVTEWNLNVPIFGQLFLETFINEKSFRRTEDLDKFALSKLKKMYGCFDTLLNLLNKNYIGLLQDINSQELVMNYRSISTVFSVTSTSGATLSLNESEQRLKEKASSDLCYYNTYLKKHTISYETVAGMIRKELSIRDCIPILMMDNLVRLKYHNDPDPGESRSMQICTLPITVKGMPKDALIVESWHDEQVCNGTDSCVCKEDKQLTKEDLEDLVLTLSPVEVDVKNRFQQLMSWGYANLLTEAFDNGIWNTLAVQTVENPDTTLMTSFASLKVDDEDDSLSLNADEMAMGNDLYHLNEMENEYFHDASSSKTPASELRIDEEEETFEQIFESRNVNVDDLEQESNIDLNHSNMSLDDSFNFTSLNFEEDDESHTEGILNTLHFTMFEPPPLLARHPPPATGKDDDILKLKEILDDILVKTNHVNMQKNHEKILFRPDNKIGSNLFKLRETNKKYQHFLPEFPLLHLRKSKINNLCSAYQHAGIVHIFKYMRDDNVKEWKKLINPDNIDKATRYIRRLSLSLHLAFICKFMQTLSMEDAEVMQEHITNKTIFGTKCETDFGLFMEKGKADNATSALHVDMMAHSDEVCAIAFAERLGREAGYYLLLSAVKTSLPFSFLSGASSYAAYCTKLLHEHFKSGPFYRRMKTTLFTTLHKGSNVNFALDSQREMDHQDVIKALRSDATVTSVLPIMSLIDTLNEVHDLTIKNTSRHNISTQEKSQEELLGIAMSETDIKYILRMTSLILRRDGISTEKNLTVFNVYELSPEILPESVLDETTKEVGRYLIKKFVAENNLFGYTKSDIPPKAEV
ncbi:unnamed protein product [Mytilus coruscus]|uniref:Uncharacterized protein n=1 Tax=Mytilus coruscus TaxID=42192 RepID=A0A6J8BZK7_MYTCO|nr:unnamed protein product [Mytilus coruscus]